MYWIKRAKLWKSGKSLIPSALVGGDQGSDKYSPAQTGAVQCSNIITGDNWTQDQIIQSARNITDNVSTNCLAQPRSVPTYIFNPQSTEDLQFSKEYLVQFESPQQSIGDSWFSFHLLVLLKPELKEPWYGYKPETIFLVSVSLARTLAVVGCWRCLHLRELLFWEKIYDWGPAVLACLVRPGVCQEPSARGCSRGQDTHRAAQRETGNCSI